MRNEVTRSSSDRPGRMLGSRANGADVHGRIAPPYAGRFGVMSNEDHPVCPACGTAAGQNQFCSRCGLNLTKQKRLPLASQHSRRMQRRAEANKVRAKRGADPLSLTGVTQRARGSRIAAPAFAVDERLLTRATAPIASARFPQSSR